MSSENAVKLGDFGIAELAADLEEEQRDRHSLVGRGKPSGGFHKRHLVGCKPSSRHSCAPIIIART